MQKGDRNMKSAKEQALDWRKLINCNSYRDVLQQFQDQRMKNQWIIKEEVWLATCCLVSVNVKAEEALKKNSLEKGYARDIFLLTEVCCETIAKCWDHVPTDFRAAVFYICKYFLAIKYIKEALAISQYVFEYQNLREIGVSSENETDVLLSLILLFLNATDKLELTSGNVTLVNEVWNFVISKIGSSIKISSVHQILKFILSLVWKSSRCAGDEYSDMCARFIKFIIRQVSEFGKHAEETFLKICCELVYQICELSVSKNKKLLLVECFETFRNRQTSCSTAINFCHGMVYIATRTLPESSSMSDVVFQCNRELNLLIKKSSPFLNDVVYFTSAVMMQMHNWAPNEQVFDKNCADSLLNMFLTLSRKNELINGDKNDVTSAVCMSNFVLYFATAIAGLDLNDDKIYGRILDAQKSCFRLVAKCCELEKKKRLHIFYTIGAGCVNICRKYMKAELYEKCLDLSLVACQGFITLEVDDLSDSNVQMCVYKLVICLCNSYRNKCLYREALETACMWTVILQGCENSVMDVYGLMKAKLLSLGTDQNYLELTCADLLKTKDGDLWSHQNLQHVNMVNLLHMELKQYLKQNISSATLVRKILEVIERKETSITEKAECYVTATKILTNSNTKECLDYVKKLAKNIDSFTNSIQNNFKLITVEKSSNLHQLLGDLYYVKFRIRLLLMRSENESDLNALNAMKKPSLAEPGMEQDLKERCDDLRINCTHLSVQTELICWLDVAVQQWHRAIEMKCTILDLSHLREAAFVYRLYCDSAKEINAWKLLYTGATLIDIPESAVFAYSNLLLTAWEIDESWKKNLEEKMLTRVDESTQLNYKLNSLSRCLANGFTQKHTDSLSEISVEQVKKHNLWTQYCHLLARCQFRNIVEVTRCPLLLSFRAYSAILYLIKNGKWKNFGQCCELQSLFFDVILFMVARFTDIYRILDAKSYLNESIDLVQKLSIPLRTCQFLNASIRLDTITCNAQDAYEKLQNALNILGTEKNLHSSEPCSLKPSQPATTRSPISNLDFRSAYDTNFPDFQTSPVLEPRLKFRSPDFVNHESTCECNMCSNIEYMLLNCEVMSLFSVYCRISRKLDDANDYFKGSFSTYKIIENRLRFRSHRIPSQFVAMRAYALFEYSTYWMTKGDLDRSEKYNNEALRCARSEDLPIYAECMERMFLIMCSQFTKLNKHKEVRSRRKAAVKPRQKIEISPYSLKTPGGKPASLFGNTENDKNNVPCELTPFPRRSRRALFDDFVTPAKSSMKSRITKKKTQLSTPPDIVLQTPSAIEKRTKKLEGTKVPLHSQLFVGETIRSRNENVITSAATVIKETKPEDNFMKTAEKKIPTRSINPLSKNAPSHWNGKEPVHSLMVTDEMACLKKKSVTSAAISTSRISRIAEKENPKNTENCKLKIGSTETRAQRTEKEASSKPILRPQMRKRRNGNDITDLK